ncbi:MAG: rhodanese-like domain-containing protein [Planctomycetota bacterium]
MQTIDVQTLAQRQTESALNFIDVRTPAEYRESHALGSRCIPLDRLHPTEVAAARDERGDKPFYFICKSGSRSSMAAKKFIDAGIPNVVSVEGGTLAWEAAGLPVARGKKTISLERQVRIAAGGLVLIGAVLGVLLNPWFIGLSAFVGAGLVFAGITDTCGMGMVLARMPWNQCEPTESP